MKQNFKSLNNTLQNIIKKYHLDEAYTDQNIKNNWDKFVNKNIYKLVKPVKLEKQILYLQVKTGYWKTEFEQVREQMLETLNQKTDPYKIKEIKFI